MSGSTLGISQPSIIAQMYWCTAHQQRYVPLCWLILCLNGDIMKFTRLKTSSGLTTSIPWCGICCLKASRRCRYPANDKPVGIGADYFSPPGGYFQSRQLYQRLADYGNQFSMGKLMPVWQAWRYAYKLVSFSGWRLLPERHQCFPERYSPAFMLHFPVSKRILLLQPYRIFIWFSDYIHYPANLVAGVYTGADCPDWLMAIAIFIPGISPSDDLIDN